MGANNSIKKHLDQDYNEIKKKWIGNQKKFEDDKFPALNRVLVSMNSAVISNGYAHMKFVTILK